MAASKRTFSSADVTELIERAMEENGAVIIKRPGRRDLALMPAEKLRSLDTTDYLLASPKNRQRLLTSLRQARAGKGRKMTVREVRRISGLNR